ncbi:MAG: SPFH domain-containing protein [Alphaproteobacteria bacterium]|jgi:regulator of protease activity HflC (stomatin/prohibitin superfamily)
MTYVIVVFAIFAVILIFKAVKTVPQGNAYTVERFGRFTRILPPGLHMITPFVDRIGARINVMENVLEVPEQDVITKDNAMVGVDGVLFFQVMEPASAAYEVNDLHRAVINLTMTNIRTVMGSMTLDELLSQRDRISGAILAVVDEATSAWGVKVTRVEIKDIEPPRDLVDSMARQMKAEREKRATILDAEGDKQSAILHAEGHKQSAILEAEGRRESAYREAEARERAAQAEAKATRDVSGAIERGDMQAINYFVAQKYVDALKALADAPNQKILFVPVESAGMIGALGSVTEIVREAFGGGGSTTRQSTTQQSSASTARTSAPRTRSAASVPETYVSPAVHVAHPSSPWETS